MQDTNSPVRLNSWKSIAAFLERDERTVQRWEKHRELPVHRVPGQRGAVFAYEHELLAWLHGAQREGDLSGSRMVPGFDEVPREVLTDSSIGPSALPEAPVEVQPSTSFRLTAMRAVWVSAVVLALAVADLSLTGWNRHLEKAPPASVVAVPAAGGRVSDNRSAAHELYLQGRFSFEKRTPDSLHLALTSFEQARAADPEYSQAYVGLAETYDLLPEFSGTPAREAFPKGLDAARTAVRLDPNSPEAHRALAFGLFYWEWHTSAAMEEFNRAIRLNPNDPQTHHWYANCLLALRRLPEAEHEIRLARDLDPRSEAILADEALIQGVRGEIDAALAKLKDLERANPGSVVPARYRLNLLQYSGRYGDWVAEVRHEASVTHDPQMVELADAAEVGWRTHQDRALLEEVRGVQEKEFARGQVSAAALANTCIKLGDYSAATRFLNLAYDENDFQVLVLLSDSSALLEHTPGFSQIRQAVSARMETARST